MRFIELFAGIGGFRHGLESVCFTNSQYEIQGTGDKEGQFIQQPHKCSNGFTCVWANEINKYACQIYKKNYGEKGELYEGDIATVNAGNIPDHELLVGGFPCQSFSIAGQRRGFNDTRGTLFFEIERICRAKKPRYILLENVKGLLSHDSGRTFQTILKVLTDIGYILQWEVLNSKNFGVPQNRERVFIVGNIRGECRPEVFPLGAYDKKDDGVQPEKKRQGAWIPCINTRYGQRWSGEGYIANQQSPQQERLISDSADSIRREAYSTVSRIRRLTPIECERLQGFPDGWTAGISDTQRYKCLGNAVTTSVITEIGKKLYDTKDNRSK